VTDGESLDEPNGQAAVSGDLTVDRVQQLLGSLEGRLPLLMELQAAAVSVRRAVDETTTQPPDPDTFSAALARLDEVTRPTAQALAWVVVWGQPGMHEPVVRSALRRLANIADQHTGTTMWLALRRWPAVLCLAAIGTVAVDAQREDLLGLALSQVVLRGPNADEPAAIGLSPNAAIDADLARQWLGRPGAYTPVEDMIGERMNDWLAPDLIESVAQVTDSYDRYQFLAGLVYFDETTRRDRSGWAPVGSFGWRRRHGWTLPDTIAAELEQRGPRWPLLSAGLFGSDAGRAKAALDGWREHVQRVSSQRL
jgi:hypothetical protein